MSARDLPADYLPGSPENARVSPDEDRACELDLKNSLRLIAARAALGLPSRPDPKKLRDWQAFLAIRQTRGWYRAYARRHPHNEPKGAA